MSNGPHSAGPPSDELKERREVWKFRLEIFTVALVFVYTTVTTAMWCQTKESVEQMKRSVEVSAEADQNSKEANRIALQGIFVEASPYIATSMLRVRRLDVGKHVVVEGLWKNIGKVPAERYGEAGFVELRTEDPPLVKLTQGKWLSDLPPGDQPMSSFKSTFVLTQEQKNQILSGAIKLYFYGAIQYNNPLEGGQTRVSSFCTWLQISDENPEHMLRGCDTPPRIEMVGLDQRAVPTHNWFPWIVPPQKRE